MNREIFNHLRDLDENLKDWESYLRDLSYETFLQNRKERHALLHAVVTAIQAAIDTGNHWVSGLTPQRPETYRSIAEILLEKKAVNSKLAGQLQDLFSLRNILIHKYQDLDLKKLYGNLKEGLGPLKSFLALVKSRLNKLL